MEKLILPDKVYNILKWVALLFLPALNTFILAVFPAWNIPYAEPIALTVSALGVFIATCIGVSQSQYKKQKEEE